MNIPLRGLYHGGWLMDGNVANWMMKQPQQMNLIELDEVGELDRFYKYDVLLS